MDIKPYLQNHARKLDLRLYEYLFENASSEVVLQELSQYQNKDGGFGHALEPDLRLPDSSVLATTVAFQYLNQLSTGASTDLIDDGIRYLLSAYDSQTNQWFNLPPAANKHARAPWWDYETSKASNEWGNPSAEVLGYLTKHRDLVEDKQLLQVVFDKAQHNLEAMTDPEPHEIKCYLRLYENSNPELQKQLREPLARNITKVTKTNPREWSGYVAKPLTFIDSPQNPFAYLFDSSLLNENANFLLNQMKNNDHWEPTWSWGDQFPDEWDKAKSEWSGKITVEYYRILNAFKAI